MTTETAVPFMSHIREFRNRLVKSLIAVGVMTIVAFAFNQQILKFLTEPYRVAVDQDLAYFRVTEAFSLIMKLSLWGGVILASPVIFYQLWRFIAPALTPREKRWVVPLIGVFVVLFFAGITVGYLALERGLGFLLDFGGDSLEPVIGAQFYMSFAMRFLLAFGISFDFPVFIFAAAAAGVVTSMQLRKGRRWAVVLILVAAAVITPSGDPLTLLMLATPMYVFYEITILAVRFLLKK